MSQNQLTNIPDSLKNLINIKILNLSQNEFEVIPDAIGGLKSLEKLSLISNKLSSLPRSIGSLENLEYLDLRMNNFSELPGSIWSLENLKELYLENNLWDEESQKVITKEIPEILKYCRKNATLNIFLSHAVADFDYFKIEKISEILRGQNEIYQAFFCEEDLSGNIDDFMNERVPESQLLLFFASQKSVFNSVDCAHELDLARTHKIQIIPIKGADVSWGDLSKIGLSRELGFEFNESEFDNFCSTITDYIIKFKKDVDLFEPEEARLDKEKFKIRNTINNLIDSEDFIEKIKINIEELQQLFEELSNNKISSLDYFVKIGQILSNK